MQLTDAEKQAKRDALNEEIEEWMNAYPAMRKAAESGGSWKFGDSNIDLLNYYVYYCDDCEKWRGEWGGYEFAVYDGVVGLRWVTCDSDGDWDSDYVCDASSDEALTVRDRTEREHQENMLDYYRHVAETGEDDADIFTAPRPAKTKHDLAIWLRGQNVVRVTLDGKDAPVTEDLLQYVSAEGDRLPDRWWLYREGHERHQPIPADLAWSELRLQQSTFDIVQPSLVPDGDLMVFRSSGEYETVTPVSDEESRAYLRERARESLLREQPAEVSD